MHYSLLYILQQLLYSLLYIFIAFAFEKAHSSMFTGSKAFTCAQCGRSYKWKGSLGQHLKYECGKEPQFACVEPGCSYRSKVKSNINAHIRKYHTKRLQRTFL